MNSNAEILYRKIANNSSHYDIHHVYQEEIFDISSLNSAVEANMGEDKFPNYHHV